MAVLGFRLSAPETEDTEHAILDRYHGRAALPRLCFGGVGGAEGGGQTDKRQAVDQPFRRIEIIPAGAVAIVGWVCVVIIVIPLAERQQ
jgi:hypothetical protein